MSIPTNHTFNLAGFTVHKENIGRITEKLTAYGLYHLIECSPRWTATAMLAVHKQDREVAEKLLTESGIMAFPLSYVEVKFE